MVELKIALPIYNKKQYNKNAPKISIIPDEIIPRLSICTAFGFKIIANTKDMIGIQIGNFLRLFDIGKILITTR